MYSKIVSNLKKWIASVLGRCLKALTNRDRLELERKEVFDSLLSKLLTEHPIFKNSYVALDGKWNCAFNGLLKVDCYFFNYDFYLILGGPESAYLDEALCLGITESQWIEAQEKRKLLLKDFELIIKNNSSTKVLFYDWYKPLVYNAFVAEIEEILNVG